MSSIIRINSDLLATWENYNHKVEASLRPMRRPAKKKGDLRLLINRASELRGTVDKLEGSKEFTLFREAMTRAIKADGYHKGNPSFWEHAIQNALRRSGYYLAIASRKSPNSRAHLTRLVKAFEPHNVTVTYLAPMELVSIDGTHIDCGSLTVRRFATPALDKILGTEISKVFYPWAVANTSFLSSYWFLVVREKIPLKPIGKIDVDFRHLGKISPQYSPYPDLEKALHRLALFKWLPDWVRTDSGKSKKEKRDQLWKGWLGFKVPFIMRITDSIFDTPSRAPNLDTLITEPYCDPFTGDEEGELPSRYINLNPREAQALTQCLQSVDQLLRSIEPFHVNITFLARALGFLIKGFFAEGLEQLLWHITTLEALLGEDKPGSTSLIAQRLAAILGDVEADRRAIRKCFNDLYDVRSRLIHGSELKTEVWASHLQDARDLARRSILWFLSFLALSSKTARPSAAKNFPHRKAILAAIDSDPDHIMQLAKILKSAPKTFPAVMAWQEPWTSLP